MEARPQGRPAKANWDWHWTVPDFEREHWWKEPSAQPLKSREAAWYELLRRHPQLESAMRAAAESNVWDTHWWATTVLEGTPPESSLRNILSVVGRRTWKGLSDQARAAFVQALGRTQLSKGKSRKATVRPLFDPSRHANSRLLLKQLRCEGERFAQDMMASSPAAWTSHPTGKNHPARGMVVRYSKRKRGTVQYDPRMQLGGLNWFAGLYHAIREGKVVLVADLETEDAGEAAQRLAESYLSIHKKAKPSAKEHKDFSDAWLTTIAKFEDSEAERRGCRQPMKVNQPERAAFRRLFDGLNLP